MAQLKAVLALTLLVALAGCTALPGVESPTPEERTVVVTAEGETEIVTRTVVHPTPSPDVVERTVVRNRTVVRVANRTVTRTIIRPSPTPRVETVVQPTPTPAEVTRTVYVTAEPTPTPTATATPSPTPTPTATPTPTPTATPLPEPDENDLNIYVEEHLADEPNGTYRAEVFVQSSYDHGAVEAHLGVVVYRVRDVSVYSESQWGVIRGTGEQGWRFNVTYSGEYADTIDRSEVVIREVRRADE